MTLAILEKDGGALAPHPLPDTALDADIAIFGEISENFFPNVSCFTLLLTSVDASVIQ